MAGPTLTLSIVVIMVVLLGVAGCHSSPPPQPTVLPAPVGTSAVAVRHNDEGIMAYQQGQWESARQHFEAAITASAELAEAHYNLGQALYRLGAVSEGNAHFVAAANLAPGNKVIWNSPPLSNVAVPEKKMKMPGDGHGHSH